VKYSMSHWVGFWVLNGFTCSGKAVVGVGVVGIVGVVGVGAGSVGAVGAMGAAVGGASIAHTYTHK
jgi:hypothetical protein